LEGALQLADQLPRAITPDMVPGLFADDIGADELAELADIMSDVRPVGTRVMAHAFADADLSTSLGSITAPVLLVYGDADERAPLHIADALLDALADARLVVLPGAGHESYLEQPDRFHDEVHRFIRTVP
jgi:pimeloyl-ACP methyl ester carboxylesterase